MVDVLKLFNWLQIEQIVSDLSICPLSITDCKRPKWRCGGCMLSARNIYNMQFAFFCACPSSSSNAFS